MTQVIGVAAPAGRISAGSKVYICALPRWRRVVRWENSIAIGLSSNGLARSHRLPLVPGAAASEPSITKGCASKKDGLRLNNVLGDEPRLRYESNPPYHHPRL